MLKKQISFDIDTNVAKKYWGKAIILKPTLTFEK